MPPSAAILSTFICFIDHQAFPFRTYWRYYWRAPTVLARNRLYLLYLSYYSLYYL